MEVVTIGEYADAKDVQRDCIRWQDVDLSEGEGASQPFDVRTKSIRVCASAPHRFVMGPDAAPNENGQRRPADAVESHNVAQGQDWRMAFKVEI